MNGQLEIDFEREKTRADQIFAAFKRFHAENPKVWRLFVRFTHEAISSGHDHHSADAICHRIRWEVGVATAGGDGVKLNNNFAAYYARMFEAAFPQHAGFFRSRVRKSVKEPAAGDDRQVFIDIKPENEESLMDELAELAGAAP